MEEWVAPIVWVVGLLVEDRLDCKVLCLLCFVICFILCI